ncbi:DUF6318 family protein [Cellulomonas persica]
MSTLTACTGARADPVDATQSAAPATAAADPSPAALQPTASATDVPTGAALDVRVPPARPAALEGPPTEENAKAVARYFLSLFPYVVATGDLEAWDALSGEPCSYCSSVRAFVSEIHDAGNHGEGGAFELGFTSGFDVGAGEFVVGIEYIETPSQTVAPDGTVVEDFPETLSYKANFSLAWTGSSWVVNGVQVDDWGKNP